MNKHSNKRQVASGKSQEQTPACGNNKKRFIIISAIALVVVAAMVITGKISNPLSNTSVGDLLIDIFVPAWFDDLCELFEQRG